MILRKLFYLKDWSRKVIRKVGTFYHGTRRNIPEVRRLKVESITRVFFF